MSAMIIDGKAIASQMRQEMTAEVAGLKGKNIIPGLATILVGDNPASHTYVNMKQKACKDMGIYSEQHNLPADITEAKLLELIEALNNNPKINGILCQLPLPGHINEHKVLCAISPKKDVDGFHPVNVGRLNCIKNIKETEKEGLFLPCTPYGIIQLIKRAGMKIEGAEAVIVGRSNIVGKPVAALLLAENATVTICHSKTKNLKEVCLRADILVAAIGKAKMITADMVKKGAVVIDVGTNRTESGQCGDVDFEKVMEIASAITPVPGGVGPMTITMLLYNTIKSAKNATI